MDRIPISCEPLCHILPHGSPVLAAEAVKVDSEVEKSLKSKWVDNHMSGFSKFVGFPIDDFEKECLGRRSAVLKKAEINRNEPFCILKPLNQV